MDGNNLLKKLRSRREISDNPEAKVRLFRVRFVCGDYDVGGAYWGCGSPLYAALGEEFQAFRRAKTRAEAKKLLLHQFPKLKFYR